VFKETCDKCGTIYVRNFDVGGVGLQDTGRKCEKPNCPGNLRDCLLDWDSPLPEDQFSKAEVLFLFSYSICVILSSYCQKHCKKADLAICLGTSLRVSPANSLPAITKSNGGSLIIVNLQETLLDNMATVKLHEYTDRVLQHIMGHLKIKIPAYGAPPAHPFRPRPEGSRRSRRLSLEPLDTEQIQADINENTAQEAEFEVASTASTTSSVPEELIMPNITTTTVQVEEIGYLAQGGSLESMDIDTSDLRTTSTGQISNPTAAGSDEVLLIMDKVRILPTDFFLQPLLTISHSFSVHQSQSTRPTLS